MKTNKYLGKLCIHNHRYKNTNKSLRNIYNRNCCECAKRISKKHYNANHEREKARMRKNYYANRKKYIKTMMEYRHKQRGGKDSYIHHKHIKCLHNTHPDWKIYLENVKQENRRAAQLKYYYKNIKTRRKEREKNAKINRQRLTDSYIKELLWKVCQTSRKELWPELIEHKRKHIMLHRLLMQGRKRLNVITNARN